MSATAPALPRGLPPEYRSLARMLRQRLVGNSESWIRPLNALRKQAIATVNRRGKTLRAETIDGIVAMWRRLPNDGQLAHTVTRGRHQLLVCDTRMIAEQMQREQWPDEGSEPAIVIGTYFLELTRTRIEMGVHPLVSLSLHCLGRRLMRSADTTDQAILRDIRMLVSRAPALIDGGEGQFRVDLGHGEWLGQVCNFVDTTGAKHVTAHARTYWA